MAVNPSRLSSHLSPMTDEHFFLFNLRFVRIRILTKLVFRIGKVVVRHLAKLSFEQLDTKLLSEVSPPPYFWFPSRLNPW